MNKDAVAPRLRKASAGATEAVIKLSVAAESWRFTAYCAFWGMCAFAITMTKIFVAPILAAGPADGSICGPFNRDSPDFGVNLGEGFDLNHSHLEELFGFANICSNWDYSPSRELTAMVYPLFEYSLIVYLCMDFAATTLANMRGELEPWFWTFSKIVFPINLFLCAMFRMIFVCIAYENVQQHTAGFLGLQVALILVAIHNTLFVWDANISYDFLGGLKNTRRAAVAYIVGDLIICSIKITATIYVVTNGRGAPWTLEPSILPGKCVGQLVDMVWMIFNAVMPLIVSYLRKERDHPLNISITQDVKYVDQVGENMPLVN